ncbi:RNA/RNP complex-1-interacting phosphatase isoform X2 [Festucalex cinctus]
MPRHDRKNGIPDRWLDYTAVGKRLGGTRFVAFKVPLKQSLNRRLAPAQAFGPWELLDAVRADRQQLGLVVDLTFTTRYYGPQDVPSSLRHVKIPTAGHVVPADDAILAFKRAVRRFLRDNRRNDKLIGVHCTHGLNRTGYLICRYLIDVDGMDPAEAIKLFNSCRGHDIERENYIHDLCNGHPRSNAGMDERPPAWVQGQAVRQMQAGGEGAARDGRWGGGGGGGGDACGFFTPAPAAKRRQAHVWPQHDVGPQFSPPAAKSREPPKRPQYEWPQHDGPQFFPPAAKSRGAPKRPQYEWSQNEGPQHYRPPPQSGHLPFPRARLPAANSSGRPRPRRAGTRGRGAPASRPARRWADQRRAAEDEGWR